MNFKQILNKNTMVKSAFWYTVGSFFLRGVNFLTTPIFIRLLTEAEIGKVTVYSTWVAIGAIVLGLGVDGTIGSAKANLAKEEYEEYLSSVLFLATLSFISISFVSIIFRESLSVLMGIDSDLIFILLVQSFFSFVISFVSATFTFEKNHKSYLTVSCLTTILNIILSISLIVSMSSGRYLGRIYGWAIATIFIGVILYIKVILKGKKLLSMKYWKFCLPIALPLIFHSLSHLLLNQADILMLQKFTDESVVGVYGTLYTVGSIINIIQAAINSAWVPWYYEALKKGDKKDIKEKSILYIMFFSILSILFMLGVPEVIKIFAPERYWRAIPLVPVIVMGYYFVYLYTFPANYQFYIKETKFIALGTITAAIINVGLNLILIPYIGMYGAAGATLIAYIILFSIHFIITKYKFKHQDFSFKYNLYGIVAVAFSWLISYILLDYFVIRWGIIILIVGLSGIIALKEIKKIS